MSYPLTFLDGACKQDELSVRRQQQDIQSSVQAACEELRRSHAKVTAAELISLASKLKAQHAAALAAALAGAEQGAAAADAAAPDAPASNMAGRSTAEQNGQPLLAASPAQEQLKEVLAVPGSCLVAAWYTCYH